MLSNELTKSGRQETCLREIQGIYKEIYQGFKDQPKKIYLTEKDFEESPDYQYIDKHRLNIRIVCYRIYDCMSR